MEFWGVEVKPGETVKCEPGDDKYIHLSQASIGETKKANENVPVFVKCGDQKLVVGNLHGDKCPQIQYDLVFEKEFELSHSSKNTSVHFCGYKTIINDDAGDMFDEMSDESEEEDEPIEAVPINAPALNGKPKAAEKAKADGPKKADASKPKPDAKSNKPKNDDDSDESEDDDDDSDEDDSDDSDEEPKELKMMEVDVDEDDSDNDEDDSDDDEDDDEDDEDESDEEEEEATPQKDSKKKRPLKDSQKTPAQENKKAKLVSPAGAHKTDGKKGGHVATPHPAKQAPKTPAANNDKAKKPQTPKSAGSVACKSCSKTFNSDNALQSHTKAKHA